MSENNINVPKIRFPGFTDAWEQRVMSNVKDVRDGTHDSPKYYNEGHPLVTSKNLTEHGLDMTDVSLISDEDFKAINQRSKVDVGDIIFGMIGTIGNPVILKRDDFAIKNVALIKRDGEVENEFLIQLLKSPVFDRYMRKENAGGTQKFLGLSQIRNFEFLAPSKAEQSKIGSFFEQLDHLITIHQRKLNHLQDEKKGLLQKMFPKNGEDFPELRFPGFTHAWKQRKLADVSAIYDGTHQTPRYTDSGIMFLSVENIKTLKSNKYISKEDFENEFKIRPEKNDVLMTRIGDIGTANVVQSDEPIAYYVSLALFKPTQIDSNFLATSIESPFVQDGLWKRTLHIAFPKKINKNEIANVEINVPSIEEQKKIGEFFKTLDETITLHQRKLNHLQERKRALLQQMFV